VQTLAADQVRAFVVTNYLFGQEGRLPADSDSLIESGVVDSTGILELIEFLEETFGIAVGDSETVPDNLGSIAAINAFVSRKLADGGRAPLSLSA
jgi:acyl carrier protein